MYPPVGGCEFYEYLLIFNNITNIFTSKKETLGWKISGAGGGGYLVLVSEKPVANAIQIRIRRG